MKNSITGRNFDRGTAVTLEFLLNKYDENNQINADDIEVEAFASSMREYVTEKYNSLIAKKETPEDVAIFLAQIKPMIGKSMHDDAVDVEMAKELVMTFQNIMEAPIPE